MAALSLPLRVVYDFSFGVLNHNFVPPTVPPPPPTFAPSIEMIATDMWTFGYGAGQNQFTRKVKHQAVWVVQDGHDVGMMIPDMTMPPSNIMLPMNWAMSSRKTMFTASTVQLDGKSPGLAVPGLCPMMTCGHPVSVPSTIPTWFLTSANAGMTWMDFFVGVGKVVVSMALDLIFHKLSGPAQAPVAGPAVESVGQAVSRHAFRYVAEAFKMDFTKTVGRESFKGLGSHFIKQGLSGAANFALDSLVTDNPTFSLGIGHPSTIEVKVDFKSGEGPEMKHDGLLDPEGPSQRFQELF